MVLDGMNRILEILANYRKREVESATEKEIVSNLFDSVNILLLTSDY